MISKSGLDNIRRILSHAIVGSPLLTDLNQGLGHQNPDAALKSWLKQYQRAQPQEKAALAPLARRVAFELTNERQSNRVYPALKELLSLHAAIYEWTALSEEDFINGNFIVLMEKGTPNIIPMPRSRNASIPTVLHLEDIPAALIALEASLDIQQETPGIQYLAAYANKISALAVVEHYKTKQPNTRDDFIAFLNNIPDRHSRTGYTGEPYSDTNALLAQIAWACKPDSLEAFWKMLYPEVTGVINGNHNNDWPQYGEAILDETLAQGRPGAIVNYRSIWKNAQSAPKDWIEHPRVQDFCSSHRDFWLNVEQKRTAHKPSAVFKTEFENYYQFFDEMCKFMEEYSSDNHREWDAAFDTNEAGIQVLLEFKNYQIILLNSPHKLIDIFKSIQDLWNVIHSVTGVLSGKSGQNVSTSRCFNQNRRALRTVLNQEDVKTILTAMSFAPRSIIPASQLSSTIEGHDRLLYLPKHSKNLGGMDESSLVDLIKNHVVLGIDLESIAAFYRPLYDAAKYKAKSLFHLIYQINDLALGSRFLEAFLGKPLSFKGLISQMGDIEAGMKLLDYVDIRQKDILIDEISVDIAPLRQQREELSVLIQRIHHSVTTLYRPILTKCTLDDIESLIGFQDFLDQKNMLMIARCQQIDPAFLWPTNQIDILRKFEKAAIEILAFGLPDNAQLSQDKVNISNESAHILLDAVLMIRSTIPLNPAHNNINLLETLCEIWSRFDDAAFREKITSSINANELYEHLCTNISWEVLSSGLAILINKGFFSEDHAKALELMHRHGVFEPTKKSEASAKDFTANISAFVRTADEAITIFTRAHVKMKLIFHAAMIPYYARLLQSKNDYIHLLHHIGTAQQAQFIDATQNKLPAFVHSYMDYIVIGSTLAVKQLSGFKEATKRFHQPLFNEPSIELIRDQIKFAVEHTDSDAHLTALINYLFQGPFTIIVSLIPIVSRKYQFNNSKTLSFLKKPLESYAITHPEINLLLELAKNRVPGDFIDELEIPLPDSLSLDDFSQLSREEYAAIIKKKPSLLENLNGWITTLHEAQYVFAHIPHHYLDSNKTLKTKINHFIDDNPGNFIHALRLYPHADSLIIRIIKHCSANTELPITLTVDKLNSCIFAPDLNAAKKLIEKFDRPYDIHHVLRVRYTVLIQTFNDLILAYGLLAHKNFPTRDTAKLSASLHVSETYQVQMLETISDKISSLISTPTQFSEALNLMRPHHQLLFKIMSPLFSSLVETEYDYYLLGKNLSQGERYVLQAQVNKNLYPRERFTIAIFKLLVESQPMGAPQHAATLELVKRFDNKNLDWGQYLQLLTDARNYRGQDVLYDRAFWLASIDDEKNRIRTTYKTVFELNPINISNATGSTVFFARQLNVEKINLENPAPINSRLSKVIAACTLKQ